MDPAATLALTRDLVKTTLVLPEDVEQLCTVEHRLFRLVRHSPLLPGLLALVRCEAGLRLHRIEMVLQNAGE